MRTALSRSSSSVMAFLAAAMFMAAASATPADEGAKKLGPPSLYDTKADGDRQIAHNPRRHLHGDEGEKRQR